MKTKIRINRIVIAGLILAITFMLISINNISVLEAESDFITTEYDNTKNELNTAEETVRELEQANMVLESRNVELDEEIVELDNKVEIMIHKTREIEVKKDYENKIEEELRQKESTIREKYYRNIPLDEKYQKYLYNVCQEFGLDYNLQLAKISLESNFRTNAVSKINSNGTRDYGISQINSCNFQWVSDLNGSKLDVKNNVYDNIRGGCLIYKHYRDYWKNKGYRGYELNIRSLNSYNRGLGGYAKHMSIEGNNWNSWSYGRVVYKRLEGIKK